MAGGERIPVVSTSAVVNQHPPQCPQSSVPSLLNQDLPQTENIHAGSSDCSMPVGRLPAEILLYIFMWFTSWDEPDWRIDKAIDQRPVILSHVCSSWRRIVLESSTLWTCLPFHQNLSVRRAIVQRSKEQPVDIVHVPLPGMTDDFDPHLEKVLKDLSDRWRSVLWESSEQKMQDMLSVLNNAVVPMSRLHTLEIGLPKRSLPGLPLHRRSDDLEESHDSLFPILEHICLSHVSLTELPPTTFPRLHSLTLHWPALYPATRPNLFRMSSLLTFLQRAPELQTLVFLKSSPLMDVHLRHSDNDPRLAAPISHGILFSPVSMPALRRLEWSYAPPRDLWRLFLHVNMPNLHHLELHLDHADQRWYTLYDGRLEPLELQDDPTISAQNDDILSFAHLHELRLYVSDADGISLALRRMEVPRLRHLTLVFLRKRNTRLTKADIRRKPAGRLPQLDALFYDPRLAMLTHLTLSDFTLESSSTVVTRTLMYLRSLEHLTFDKCEGAGEVVCALSGADCGSALGAARSWSCPSLQHLTIINCKDVAFRCLKETVFVRKAYAEGRVQDKRESRPLKALRRQAKKPENRPAGGSSVEQDLAELYVTTPSSLFERIRSVVVQGGIISETELLSLQGDDYGVDDVHWTS